MEQVGLAQPRLAPDEQRVVGACGRSATATAEACANRFDAPITKVSKVYFGFRLTGVPDAEAVEVVGRSAKYDDHSAPGVAFGAPGPEESVAPE